MFRRHVLPDAALDAVLSRVQRRSHLRTLAMAVAFGGAVFALALIATVLGADASRRNALGIAFGSGVLATVWFGLSTRRLTRLDAAAAIERVAGPFDNLIVTAAELDERPRAVSEEIRGEIARQSASRLGSVDVARVTPLAQPIGVAIAVLAGCVVLGGIGAESIATQIAASQQPRTQTASGSSRFTVTITPPAYTKRSPESIGDPVQISVLAGSRVRIETGGRVFREWVAESSEGLEVRSSADADPRFLSVQVVPDAPPTLRIVTPGKDSAFATPVGEVAIQIDSHDDLGLATLALRFTKASGGGENVSFTEGELPLALERRSDRQWVGRASVSLPALQLADGDILVYRAIARDSNPAGAPVPSEQYLIEIGKAAQISDAGFSLPSEEKKYAISQQMVIYKTEQLLARARQGGTAAPNALEESRMIAMEQRMVRAEVVFLGGGEVEDEVEEAAHSHELAEGRLQNTGRAEMMRALNAMSRAEALLNDGDAKAALVFEREALASLERALDRRRYFLRTLPDRSRVDITRRLSGTRTEARSWLRDPSTASTVSPVAAHRRAMQELVAASSGATAVDASLAARVAAIDPADGGLQKAAVAIASASTPAARAAAVTSAMQAVTAHALKTVPAGAAIDVRRDALAGQLASELERRR